MHGSLPTSPFATRKTCKPALLITFYSFILSLWATLFELHRSHTMHRQCDWKTLTNVEYVRIWKEAVVCSFMVLRLGILKARKHRWVILVVGDTSRGGDSQQQPVIMKQSGRTHASIAIVAVYVADKCQRHLVRTFEMCGMNIPVNRIEIRSGQEFKNLLLKFQRSSYRVLYKTRLNITTTHTSLVDFRFRGDMR